MSLETHTFVSLTTNFCTDGAYQLCRWLRNSQKLRTQVMTDDPEAKGGIQGVEVRSAAAGVADRRADQERERHEEEDGRGGDGRGGDGQDVAEPLHEARRAGQGAGQAKDRRRSAAAAAAVLVARRRRSALARRERPIVWIVGKSPSML